MSKFGMILTNAGIAKVINAQMTQEKMEIVQFAVGDANGTPYTPVQEAVALRNEKWRGPVAAVEIEVNNPHWIVVTCPIPAQHGGFMIHEAGLYDAHGDLIAIGRTPESYKPVLSEGASKDFIMEPIIEVSNASSVTLRIDPNVIQASRQYVNEKIEHVDEKVTKINTDSIKITPMPNKIGAQCNSPKLVIVGETNDKLNILQYNGKNYVLYELDASPGTTSVSEGGKWELIRLKKAIMVHDAYVAKTAYTNVVGNVDTLYAPAARSEIETMITFPHSDENTARFISASGDGHGIGCYGLSGVSAVSSVDFKINIGTAKKANILVLGSQASAQSVDVLVNGELVCNFDASKIISANTAALKLIEFDIPSRLNASAEITVTLRNNDLTGKKLYFSCANFYALKDYNGQDIDFYKAFVTSNVWIDHAGASDYAILDADTNLWCGSYHGGEKRLTAQITWGTDSAYNHVKHFASTSKTTLRYKDNVPAGWYILPSFKIYQVTDINGKGKMISIFDFDDDGTIQMSFSFYDGVIRAKTFYTALTTTHLSFNTIRYPFYKELPTPPMNLYLPPHDGYLVQSNVEKRMSLGHRFSKFESTYINDPLRKNGWIKNHEEYYKKPYYAFVDNDEGVLINTLQFTKSLDFIKD